MNLEYLSEKSGRVRQATRYSTHAKARRKDDVIILDGVHLVQEAIHELGAECLMSFFVTEEALSQFEVSDIAQNLDDRLGGVVPPSVMRRMAATVSPQGILAVFKRPANAMEVPHEGFILALEDIQDPVNIGAMIRTGVSLGVDAVILSKGCADVWGPRVLRASQGAHFSAVIYNDVHLEQAAQSFDGSVVVTVLNDTAQSLYETTLTGDTMLIMGNEGVGVTHELQQCSNQHITIPLRGKFESLNVASACAIVCGERLRQTLTDV